MTIRKKGPHTYQLISGEGKVLGTHHSREGAQRQETAINISKARAHGHKIPKPKGKR